MKKLVFGVGINDADYVVKPTINGKQVVCPIFLAWKGMLQRCYDKRGLVKLKTYLDCKVSKEWLTFSNFRSWVLAQDYEGKQLDKDIIKIGNKIYSPKFCAFVDSKVNSLLVGIGKKKGKNLTGAYPKRNRFMAQCEGEYLGYFKTEKEAHSAYCVRKSELIRKVAINQEPRVSDGLIRHAVELEKGIISNG